MKILVLTNLFPPHHADTDDFRCQNVTEALRARGHTVRVLTSTCGLASEAGHTARGFSVGADGDALVQRRLRLNGAYGQPAVSSLSELRELEARNQGVLREALAAYAPELVHVWNLTGLSKSLMLTLRRANVPTVFDVAEPWVTEQLRTDPWLSWWHRERVSLPHRLKRGMMEFLNLRTKWDAETPTFIEPGVRRLPAVFDHEHDASFKPNAAASFQFRRLYFSSLALKAATVTAGFRVSHAAVIHPGVDTKLFHGEVKPASAAVKKFLIVTRLNPQCGIATAIDALRLVRAQGVKANLTVYGRGSSEVLAKLRTRAVQGEVPVDFRSGGLQRELPLIYQSHDALIYPVETAEAFVGPPLEAMACGLPVIVNQDHGVEDLFTSNESCLTYPSGDSGLLANRMLELIQTPGLAAQLAEVGQNEVLTRYQFATAVEHIERYLEDSLAQWQSM